MQKNRLTAYASPMAKLLLPLFESVPDGVVVVDHKYTILFVNPAFLDLHLQSTTFSFDPGTVLPEKKNSQTTLVDIKIWEKVLHGEEFSLTEEEGTGKGKKFFEIRFVPIRGEKKNEKKDILGAAAFIKDVSLLRRAEIDLIENRITLQETQSLARITRWSFSLTHDSVDWDSVFPQIFGLPADADKQKRNLFAAFSPKEKSEILERIEKALHENQTELSFDSSFHHEERGKCFLHTLGKIEDRDGEKMFIGVSHDVTDSKMAERALGDQNKELQNTKAAMLNVLEDVQALEKKTQEKVQHLGAILSSMQEALVAVDSDGKVSLINQAAAALFRIAPDEAVGLPILELAPLYHANKKLTPKSHPVMRAVGESTILSYAMSDELSLKDQTGKLVPVAITASFIPGDLPIRAIMILRDITREKEVDVAKTELISLASHQLRTPLSSVNWYSEMLMNGDAGVLTDEQKNYISEIYKGNQRMIELVNALLNVSRMDLGTLAVEPEQLSVKDIIDGTIADLVSLIKEKNLQVSTKVPAKMEKYLGDKKILMIIIQNLLSNAVKYTPEHGVVTASVLKNTKGEIIGGHTLKQDSLLIMVSDNGYGIPEKEKAKIFQKMYRADNVKDLEANGNGLGLYLIKAMIESLGGAIWFESTEGKGTTFYVALPLSGMHIRTGATMFT